MVSWLERLRDALAPGIAVEREIASGGMGHVALGRDTVLDRAIAIKLLKPELGTAVNTERFLREARNAAGLRHPNVVRVHHAADVAGLLYYTMDYVPGDTLAARLRGGHLSPREVVRLGLDLLSALGAAHARQLIHRDVKPSNIFLAPGRALLADFGVAYALDSSLTTLSSPGTPVGTLAYISPEQLHDGPVDERTDLYAVGLVLYEAATGRRWEPLTEPGKGDWSRVPRHLRDPIRRALQVRPAGRWPDTVAFAAALVMAERRAARNRLLAVSAAVTLAGALIAAFPPCLWRCERTSDVAVAPFGTVGLADSSLGPRLAHLTGWSLEMLSDLEVAPSRRVMRFWRSSTLAPAKRLQRLTGATQSAYGAYGEVYPRGRFLEVRLSVVAADGSPVFQGAVVGDSADRTALADSIALTIVAAVHAGRSSEAPVPRVGLPPRAEFLADPSAVPEVDCHMIEAQFRLPMFLRIGDDLRFGSTYARERARTCRS